MKASKTQYNMVAGALLALLVPLCGTLADDARRARPAGQITASKSNLS